MSSLKIRSVAFLVILGYRRSLFRCSKSTRSIFRLLMVITVAFSVAFLVIHSEILGQKQPWKTTEVWLLTVVPSARVGMKFYISFVNFIVQHGNFVGTDRL